MRYQDIEIGQKVILTDRKGIEAEVTGKFVFDGREHVQTMANGDDTTVIFDYPSDVEPIPTKGMVKPVADFPCCEHANPAPGWTHDDPFAGIEESYELDATRPATS